MLILDNCVALSQDTPFIRNVKVVYLLSNCTSMLQPPDFGFIKVSVAQETHIKKLYAQWTEENNIELKINGLQMIHFTVLTPKQLWQLECHVSFGNNNPSLLPRKC